MKYTWSICCIWLLFILSACDTSQPADQSEPKAEKSPSTTMLSTKPAPTRSDSATSPKEAATEVQTTEFAPTPKVRESVVTFQKTFGGDRRDRGINLLQTKDGGYAIIGYTSSHDAVQEDVYLVRLDDTGQELWSNTYGGDGKDNGWAVMETEDAGFLITGFTNSFGAGEMDIYLVRTDAGGNMLWERTFGGPNVEYGWAMARTSDGGYVLAGQTDSYGEGKEDGYLVKVNDQGDEIWSQTFGGPEEDRLFSVDQGGDDGFVLAGTTRSFGAGNIANRDAYLVKTDSSGELVWTQVYGEEWDDVAHSIRQTDEEGYIATGYTKSFGASNYDTWLIKTNREGVVQWQHFYGESGDDRTISGEQTEDGGYIMTGYTTGFDSVGWDVFLVRTDSSGTVNWHKTFGGRADDTGYTVTQTADGGFLVTGETYSSGEGGGDMVVIKVDRNGELTDVGD